MLNPFSNRSYPTDLTNQQWKLITKWVRRKPGAGRPTRVNLRQVVNAIFYLVKTGCHWRMIPTHFPPWTTVRYYYDKWTDNGVWTRLNRFLRCLCREAAGRNAESVSNN